MRQYVCAFILWNTFPFPYNGVDLKMCFFALTFPVKNEWEHFTFVG